VNKIKSKYNLPIIKNALKLMGRQEILFLVCTLVFCAVEIVGSILYTTGIRGAIDALGGTDWGIFGRNVLLILSASLLWWIWAPIASYNCAAASKRTVQRLKTDLFEQMIRMPMVELDKRPKGELLSALTNDISSLSHLYDWYFFQICRTSLGGLAGVVIMFSLDWRFGTVVFVLGTLSVLIASRFNKKLEENGEMLQKNLAASASDAYELVKGAKSIRLLKLQSHFTKKIAGSTAKEAETKIENGAITSRMKVAVTAINALSYIAILVAGAVFVYFKWSDWGTVVALMGLKITTDMLFVEFGEFMAGTQNCVAGIRRVFTLLEAPTEEETLPHVSFMPDHAPVTLESVSFSYTDKPVLEDFNMTVGANQLTVLKGESGSGKSTVMKLILGLYSPQKGELIFSGTDPNSTESIRRKTAYVPQEPILFRSSVLENILFGNPDATPEDAVKAAISAGADDFITRMPSGYETHLTDDGGNLSGGQKQRIAIARALVKTAPILLLDEITSALDVETEAHILETVKALSKDHAVVFITHKPGAERFADTIYRM